MCVVFFHIPLLTFSHSVLQIWFVTWLILIQSHCMFSQSVFVSFFTVSEEDGVIPPTPTLTSTNTQNAHGVYKGAGSWVALQFLVLITKNVRRMKSSQCRKSTTVFPTSMGLLHMCAFFSTAHLSVCRPDILSPNTDSILTVFFSFFASLILSSLYCSSTHHFSPSPRPSSASSLVLILFFLPWHYVTPLRPPLQSSSSRHSSSSPPQPSRFLPLCFSCDRLPVSSSLQRAKAVSPSPRQWPIESCWAPISLLIGWAGLSRYWEEGLALLAPLLSAYPSVCLHDRLCLCSRADLILASSHP